MCPIEGVLNGTAAGAELFVLARSDEGGGKARSLRWCDSVNCTRPARGTLGTAPLAVPQCGQHVAQYRPAARIGICNTGGVVPQVPQGRVLWLTRMQLRGPGSVEGAFGLTFVLRIEVPSLASPPVCGHAG